VERRYSRGRIPAMNKPWVRVSATSTFTVLYALLGETSDCSVFPKIVCKCIEAWGLLGGCGSYASLFV
jgi:hypothetical protein